MNESPAPVPVPPWHRGPSFWLDTHPVPERGVPLRDGEEYDAVVVGAGLTGLVTAVLLATAGWRTCLLEARTVGAVATGNTTAKVSLLQGTLLSQVRARQGERALRGYVAANAAGQEWLRDFLTSHGGTWQVRDAFTYAQHDATRSALEDELAAARVAGLPVEWLDHPGLPFPVAGALRLTDQAQIHPTETLDLLLTEFLALGGTLHTGARVRDVAAGQPCRISTDAGELRADQVVLATGVPFLDRGAHFARVRAERSYALAVRVPGAVPSGMYLSADQPTRSLRTASGPDGEVLLVGGNGHVVGRQESPRHLVDELARWAAEYFPGAEVTHVWSAQDYNPASGVPIVQTLAWSRNRVHVATGFHKWGMANAVAAGLRLAATLAGGEPAWARELDGGRPGAGLIEAAAFNAEVAAAMTSGWVGATSRSLPEEPPAEGTGVVGRVGAKPAARSTVDGQTCTVSAVCTHLGGILAWNDAERSWDCPLHGSRFAPDGRVLEGPAVTDLETLS